MPASSAVLLDRVRKLLALAESPNVHEAASAAALAQTLIDKHRLQALLEADRAEAIATEALDDGRDSPLETGRRVRTWKTVLASGLARLNGCVAYTTGRKKTAQLLVAGQPGDRAAVLEIWTWLVHRIELLSATQGPGEDRSWHDAFRIGAAEEILGRMAASQQAVHQEVEPTALVSVKEGLARRNAAVQQYAEQTLRLRPGRALRVDADGYARGKAAGATLKL